MPIQSAGEPSSAVLFVITSTLLGRPELVSSDGPRAALQHGHSGAVRGDPQRRLAAQPRALDDVADPMAEDLARDGHGDEAIAGESRHPVRGPDEQRALAARPAVVSAQRLRCRGWAGRSLRRRRRRRPPARRATPWSVAIQRTVSPAASVVSSRPRMRLLGRPSRGAGERPLPVAQMGEPAVEGADPQAAVLRRAHGRAGSSSPSRRGSGTAHPRPAVVAREPVLRRRPHEPALVGQHVDDRVLGEARPLVEHDPGEAAGRRGLDGEARRARGRRKPVVRGGDTDSRKERPRQERGRLSPRVSAAARSYQAGQHESLPRPTDPAVSG